MTKHYETFHLNQKFIFIFTVWELADVESEKYMQRRIESTAKFAKIMN